MLHLGKYLGSSIDVGPTMTAMILQHDGEVVYHSTYQSLTVEEQADLTIQKDMITFRESVEDFLGEKLTHNELQELRIPDIPEFYLMLTRIRTK